MTKLYDKNNNIVPNRPVLTDQETLNSVIEEGFKSFSKRRFYNAELFGNEDVEDTIFSLKNCYSYDMDSYDLTKALEHSGYFVDRCFIDEMDELIVLFSKHLNILTKEWFDKYSPQPPLPIGSKVKYFVDGEICHGTITDFSNYDVCHYEVKDENSNEDDTTRRIFSFEKLASLNKK